MDESKMCKMKELRQKLLTILWFHLYEVFKSVKSIDRKQAQLLGAGGGKNGEWSLNGSRVFLWGDEKVLELEVLVSRHCDFTKYTELYALS